MKKVHKFPDVKFKKVEYGSSMEVDVRMGRIERNTNRAQYELDTTVMNSMIPFMPMITFTFINLTKGLSDSIAGSGKVYAGAPPYGRFLYEGKTMVDESTGSTWARRSAKKVLVSEYTGQTNAKVNLEFTKTFHPRVQAEWFEGAKKADLPVWLRKVKKCIGDS